MSRPLVHVFAAVGRSRAYSRNRLLDINSYEVLPTRSPQDSSTASNLKGNAKTLASSQLGSNEVAARAPASQRANSVAAPPPSSWPRTKSGTLYGEIPAKVSVIARAKVTAGLANEVDDVNQ